MYKQLQTEVLRRRNAKIYDSTSMDLAGKLLELNPEVYTVWNFRREALLSKLDAPDATMKQDWLDEELQMTEKGLKRNHKSYCTWHHRKWAVQRYATHFPQAAPAVLQRELGLCGKLLQMDERNFHCWGYRRYIAYLAKLSEADELAFTTEKINQTFSNYSAWHHRSAVLPLLHCAPAAEGSAAAGTAAVSTKAVPTQLYARPGEGAAGGAGAAGERQGLPVAAAEREFDLVAQALYTEPEDQAGWFYHAWVVGKVLLNAGAAGTPEAWGEAAAALEKQAGLCRELLALEPGSKWPTLTLTRLLTASALCAARARAAGSGGEGTSGTAGGGGGAAAAAADGEVLALLEELAGSDPLRGGYYRDAMARGVALGVAGGGARGGAAAVVAVGA